VNDGEAGALRLAQRTGDLIEVNAAPLLRLFVIRIRRQFGIAAVLTIGGLSLAFANEPAMRFPNAFAFATASRVCAAAYFHCNHNGTCMRGHASHRGFAGVMLADDRKTVIAHVACCDAEHRCTNFDTGAVTIMGHGRPVVVRELTEDMSASAVEKMRSKVAHCIPRDES
jgi:hypothetical protein